MNRVRPVESPSMIRNPSAAFISPKLRAAGEYRANRRVSHGQLGGTRQKTARVTCSDRAIGEQYGNDGEFRIAGLPVQHPRALVAANTPFPRDPETRPPSRSRPAPFPTPRPSQVQPRRIPLVEETRAAARLFNPSAIVSTTGRSSEL